MRSISNFPSHKRTRHGRIGGSNGKSGSRSPVWGSAVSSPVAVSALDTSESVSTSKAPVPKSPTWRRRSGIVSPSSIHRPRQHKPGITADRTSRSLSPQLQQHRGPRQHFQSQPDGNGANKSHTRSLSSSPRIHRRQQSSDLCTIAEDRRISSNTLKEMAITTPAKYIAKNPTLATQYSPKQRRKRQQRRDPYNDDWDTMEESTVDCSSCCSYTKKDENQGCWFFFSSNNKIHRESKKERSNGT